MSQNTTQVVKSLYYCALLYDYGQINKGMSYEYDNMELDIATFCLKNDIIFRAFHPDVPGEMEKLRSAPMSDAIFHVAFNDSLDLPLDIALNYIKNNKKVIQWDCDSSYRFFNWILPRKNRCTHFITTHSQMEKIYHSHNMKVIKSQWAGSASHYYMDLPKIYDVSFVGQSHGIRQQIMDYLYNANLNIHIWGDFWDSAKNKNYHGRCENTRGIVTIFNSSKINLNLQNPWQPGTPTQIKGRIMQIPACSGFQLATYADDVENYFIPDREIVIANDVRGLIDKISYYLSNDKERECIAAAGYRRVLREHQWHHRFEAILKEII